MQKITIVNSHKSSSTLHSSLLLVVIAIQYDGKLYKLQKKILFTSIKGSSWNKKYTFSHHKSRETIVVELCKFIKLHFTPIVAA